MSSVGVQRTVYQKTAEVLREQVREACLLYTSDAADE